MCVLWDFIWNFNSLFGNSQTNQGAENNHEWIEVASGAELLGDSGFNRFESIFEKTKTTMLMFMMVEAYMGEPEEGKDNKTHIQNFKSGTSKPFWTAVAVPAGLEELCALHPFKSSVWKACRLAIRNAES